LQQLCTLLEGFGEPTPSVPAWMLHSAQRLTLVPSEPLVAPSLYLHLLPELHFPGHPQPWSLRKCVGGFELVAPLPFECPSAAQKAQSVGPGHQGSDQSVAVSALVLLDLDQKLLVSAQVTLGLFLGVLALVVLGDRAASALDQWFGVDWWFLGVVTGVVVVMEGAQ
jgi:hypothetical protein